MAQVKNQRAELFDIALSDEDGFTDFYASGGLPATLLAPVFPQGWDLSGSIRKPKEHLNRYPWCTFEKPIKVKTMKLDTWVQEKGIDCIDFIWADVQGAEIDLIHGGRETFKHTRYFYTEYSNDELYEGQANLGQLINLLQNFKVIRRYKFDVLFKNANASMP